MVAYMLSKSTEGRVLYDDDDQTAVLRASLNTVLLVAAKAICENGDPVHGGLDHSARDRSADTAIPTEV